MANKLPIDRHAPRARVFVLEDSPQISFDLASAADELGCEIVGPMHELSSDVTELAEQGNVDVAIVDLVLSNGYSEGIIRTFQKRGVPVVVCSRLMVKAVQREFPNATVLGKPHSNDALQKILLGLLKRRAGEANAG